MTPKERFNFMIEPDQLAALRAIEAKTGAPIGEQIRRAIKMWLELNEQAPTLMGAVNRKEDKRKK